MDYELAEIRERCIRNTDIILAEGYKGNPHPKIEAFRTELRKERLCGPEDNLIAPAGDQPAETKYLKALFLTNMLPWHQWNRIKTAKSLGIHEGTVFRKIKALRIQIPKDNGSEAGGS